MSFSHHIRSDLCVRASMELSDGLPLEILKLMRTRVCFHRSVPMNHVHVINLPNRRQELDRAVPGPEAIIHIISWYMDAVSRCRLVLLLHGSDAGSDTSLSLILILSLPFLCCLSTSLSEQTNHSLVAWRLFRHPIIISLDNFHAMHELSLPETLDVLSCIISCLDQ
jgi:hypothetical protein